MACRSGESRSRGGVGGLQALTYQASTFYSVVIADTLREHTRYSGILCRE